MTHRESMKKLINSRVIQPILQAKLGNIKDYSQTLDRVDILYYLSELFHSNKKCNILP